MEEVLQKEDFHAIRKAYTGEVVFRIKAQLRRQQYQMASSPVDKARLTGREFLFLSHLMESADGYILLGDKEQNMIAEETAEGVYRFTFDAGYNFIVPKGDDFTGSLSLIVE
ncbi:hypothetical protein MUB23_19580 [Cuneatibacter sp. NSJ-177]|uniref:hypothetical protein n=1 Tax=Cuneatibacter sp. NSJ-177 TaxID=2931401 RepID=UPI001FD5989C|nr:hypothetical protein [Cuneatibacter sp. NSJ-177]MCJ7837578.1 hypothetical protein [Cuneatibacter sp. NSJ-177]